MRDPAAGGRRGFGVPRKDFGAQSILLHLANLADEVVLLEEILSQAVVLFFLFSKVVDVFRCPCILAALKRSGLQAKNRLRSSGDANKVRPGYSPSITS